MNLLFCSIKSASFFAYIDPGTGGMFIGGSLWVFIVMFFSVIGAFFLKYFYKPIKKGLLSLWKRVKGKE